MHLVSFVLCILPFLASYVWNSTYYNVQFGSVTASFLKSEQMQTPLVTAKQPSPLSQRPKCTVKALFRALKYDSLHFTDDYLVMWRHVNEHWFKHSQMRAACPALHVFPCSDKRNNNLPVTGSTVCNLYTFLL
jgi:hypothetical protein